MKTETKLGPAVFQSLKESLFKQGECQHNEVLDALHEEATMAARSEVSSCTSIEPDTLNDAQWEELIGAYKSGFWEPTTTHTRLQA